MFVFEVSLWRNRRSWSSARTFHIHEEIVEKVDADMPDEEILYDLAELFKIFGDSTRIKILYVLFESEMCVCDIAQLLGMTPVGHLPISSGR